LRDDAPRTETPRQQRLADGVVDLVRTGMREVLALEPHLGAPARREPLGEGERRGTAHPAAQLPDELGLKRVRVQVLAHAAREALERRDQGFGDIASAEGPKATARVRKSAGDQFAQQPLRIQRNCLCIHSESSVVSRARAAARTASTKSPIAAGLFTPGHSSTPLETSTPNGCTAAMAAPTLPRFRPPA